MVNAYGEPVEFAGNESILLTSLRVRWSGFVDVCAGVREYVVSVRHADESGSSPPLWQYVAPADDYVTALAFNFTEGVYQISVTAINHAHLTRTRSAALLVDWTPPHVPRPSFQWELSAGSGPNTTCAPATAHTIEVRWEGAHDDQSGIANFWVAATDPFVGLASAQWQATGLMHSWRIKIDRLHTKGHAASVLTLHARACNHAHMCAVSEGTELALVSREPGAGRVRLAGRKPQTTSNALVSPPSEGFLAITQGLEVTFSDFVAAGCPTVCNAPSMYCFYDTSCSSVAPLRGGVGCNAGGAGRNCQACGASLNVTCPAPSRPPPDIANELDYQVCIGTTAFGCQLIPFSSVGANQSWHRGREELPPLQCGSTYYAAVRATNCAGLQRVVASEPIQLCCRPPTAGRVTVVDAYGEAVEFVGNESTSLRVQWSGFADVCAGLREYVVSVRRADERSPLWSVGPLEPNSSAVTLSAEQLIALQLEHGVAHEVVVSATSWAGLVTSVAAPLLVDHRAPRPARLYSGPHHADVACVAHWQPLVLSWERPEDDVSGIATCAWALGTRPCSADLRPWERLPNWLATQLKAALPNSTLWTPGTIVFASLRCFDRAGNAKTTTSNGVRVVGGNLGGELVAHLSSSLVCMNRPATAREEWLCEESTPREPRREGGVPPQFLPLVVSWVECTYDVRGSAFLPHMGRPGLAMRVRLRKLWETEGESGSTLSLSHR